MDLNIKTNQKIAVGGGILAIIVAAVVVSNIFPLIDNQDTKTTSDPIPKPPPVLLSDVGSKMPSFSEAKQKIGLTSAREPSYIPSGLVLDSVRTIENTNGDEIMLIYLSSDIKSSEQTTIQEAIDNGLVVSIKNEKNRTFNWNEFVKQQVIENPTIRNSILVGDDEVLLIQKNPETGYPFAAKTFKGDLRIEIYSQQLDTDVLQKVITSMMTQ